MFGGFDDEGEIRGIWGRSCHEAPRILVLRRKGRALSSFAIKAIAIEAEFTKA